jgi:translation initiation factor 4A
MSNLQKKMVDSDLDRLKVLEHQVLEDKQKVFMLEDKQKVFMLEDKQKVEDQELEDQELEDQELEEIMNWDDLDISPELLRGIYAYGFERPSPIQSKAIMPIVRGKDVIAQAQSGTGKTAAFTIGLLSRVDTSLKEVQVLVLSPTRELSSQTCNVIEKLGMMVPGFRVMNMVGGGSVEEDAFLLKRDPPHVVTGCPGRIYDMIRRNYLVAKNVRLFVLDEGDEMLSSGFKDQVYQIFQYLNNDVQVALFSATLPDSVQEVTNKFMRNPMKILVKTESLTLEGISQYFVAVQDDRDKYDTLKDLFSFISMSQCIIYCNSVKRVIDLYDAMLRDQFPVCCIHSNMDKASRDLAFQEFRVGKQRVLISSNVTARGIDIQQVSTVINFDVPQCVASYLHRIGRSGRWGRKGVGINFIVPRDIQKIREIESFYSTQIKELPNHIVT